MIRRWHPISKRPAKSSPLHRMRTGFRQTIDMLRAEGIDAVVVGPVPQIGWNVPSTLATMAWRNKPLPDGPSLDDFMNIQRKIMPLLKELERDHIRMIYPR